MDIIETTPGQSIVTAPVITKLDKIAYTKSQRRNLDDILQSIKAASPSRERSLTITKLQEAIMWLGQDLKVIGLEPNPYPNSYDTASPVVDPVSEGLKI